MQGRPGAKNYNNENVQISQQSSDRSCFCTNTRTHTRQNKPYRLGVVPAGVAGARGRCCPAAAVWTASAVPVAFVFACGVCCCIAEKIQNKIIDRKKSSAIIVHQAKGTATSTRTTHTRVSKMGFWVCGSEGVFESCTFYLHDGRANRGCRRLSKPVPTVKSRGQDLSLPPRPVIHCRHSFPSRCRDRQDAGNTMNSHYSNNSTNAH